MPTYLCGLGLIGLAFVMVRYETVTFLKRRRLDRLYDRLPPEQRLRNAEGHAIAMGKPLHELTLIFVAALLMVAGGGYLFWLDYVNAEEAQRRGMSLAIGIAFVAGGAYFIQSVLGMIRKTEETPLPVDHLPVDEQVRLQDDREHAFRGKPLLIALTVICGAGLSAFGIYVIYLSNAR